MYHAHAIRVMGNFKTPLRSAFRSGHVERRQKQCLISLEWAVCSMNSYTFYKFYYLTNDKIYRSNTRYLFQQYDCGFNSISNDH